MSDGPNLFSPLTIRGVTLSNRLVLSPMCQYSAGLGIANDWHLIHYGRFALGGFGTVMVEATAVTRQGQGTHGDLGIWNNVQAAALGRIAAVLRLNGATPGIQLAHAGRKGSATRPWEGHRALTATDAARGDAPWETIAPSAEPHAPGWDMPREMTEADMIEVLDAYEAGARRAIGAGFDIVEIHAAHGYLLHEFLSPLSNTRTDEYGGSRDNRMRFPLAVIARVREALPADKPLFVRVSAIDALPGGWDQDDTVAFAAAARSLGVDVIDCSSGGFNGYQGASYPGYQAPHTARVKADTGMFGMAVGLITEPALADDLISGGQADLVALAREALVDPQWPLHARKALGEAAADFSRWPIQSAWWLEGRARNGR